MDKACQNLNPPFSMLIRNFCPTIVKLLTTRRRSNPSSVLPAKANPIGLILVIEKNNFQNVKKRMAIIICNKP
jgi:hypothetical protein